MEYLTPSVYRAFACAALLGSMIRVRSLGGKVIIIAGRLDVKSDWLAPCNEGYCYACLVGENIYSRT